MIRCRRNNHTILLCALLLSLPLIATSLKTNTSHRLLRKGHKAQYADLMDDDSYPRHGEVAPSARLSDVWLCLGMAFGWAVFLVRTLVGGTAIQRYESEGLHVKGSVLESTVNPDGEAGIPTYHALIDYVYHDNGNESDIQIRKAYPTETLLNKGFSNVDMLVLPDDPTSGVLVDEWAREVEEERKNEAETRGITLFSYILGILFILLSIFGAFHAVRLLPDEQKTSGWVSLAFGIALLGPVSFLCYSMTAVLISRSQNHPILACQVPTHCMTPAQFHDVYSAHGHQAQQTNDFDNNMMNDAKHRYGAFKNKAMDPNKEYYFVCMPPRDNSISDSSMSSISTRSFPHFARPSITKNASTMQEDATPETKVRCGNPGEEE